jgi:hypothetical protein
VDEFSTTKLGLKLTKEDKEKIEFKLANSKHNIFQTNLKVNLKSNDANIAQSFG